jgi:sugar phosphate isomerase/epimerase
MKFTNFILTFFLCSAFFATAAAPLGVFDFDLRGKDLAERVQSVDRIGYEGLTMWLNTDKDLAKLEAYQKVKPDFKLIAAIIIINIDKPESFKREHVKTAAHKLAAMNAKLWLIVQGTKEKTSEIQTLINEVAEIAATEKCGVSLYPHDSCAVETAEEMLVYLKKANQPNLSISVHQCHELRAGNMGRLDEVISAVGSYMDIVTICGSDKKVNDNSEDWSDAIKPLGEGDYDPKEFLRVLKKHNFKGPIVLHTFGLMEKAASHYQTSYDLYQKMCAELNTEPN